MNYTNFKANHLNKASNGYCEALLNDYMKFIYINSKYIFNYVS